MKIKSITYTQRFNMGNYEHIEISAVAEIEDQDKADQAMASLKQYVQKGLTAKKESEEIPTGIKAKEAIIIEEELAKEAPVKEKKPKAKKEKVIEATLESDNTITEKIVEKKKPAIAYDSSVPEHKSILGGYLSKKYDNAWKTAKPTQEIKDFTTSLNGKEFVDTDGKIVDSFLELIHGFFGA
jgi:hypothetical protein